MSSAVELYVILIVVGFLMVIIETFVPGAVIGIIGTACLFAAAVTGFVAFGPQSGFIALVFLIIACGVGLGLWMKLLPNSPLGRRMTLQRDGRDFKSSGSENETLVGQVGEAISSLRPSGIAQFGDKRLDVVADAAYVAVGARVKITVVEGSRIVVTEVPS